MTDSGSGATSRKGFIAATAALGAAFAVPSPSKAEDGPPVAPPSPAVSPSPKASPTPSPAAEEIAKTMRRFDSTLTDEQIASIARGIDDQNKYAHLIRKRQPLHNGDEPAPEFEVQ